MGVYTQIFLELFVLVYTFIATIIHYTLWKELRPEVTTKVKGIPACLIWDGVWFVWEVLACLDHDNAWIVAVLLMWKLMRDTQKNPAVELRNQMISEEYQRINEMNLEMQYLRHDWKNHLLAIQSFVKEENYTDLGKYVGSLQDVSNDTQMNMITGNSMVDVILNQKTAIAKDKEIDVQIKCDYMKGMKVEEKDICVLLANLYDNAIEGAEKVEVNPWIHIEVVRNGDMLMMKFCNNYSKKPKKLLDRFLSDKKEKEKHGFGLMSVKHTVKEYEGDLDTSFDGEKFTACVTIYDGFEG